MKSSRVCWRPGPSGFSRNKYTHRLERGHDKIHDARENRACTVFKMADVYSTIVRREIAERISSLERSAIASHRSSFSKHQRTLRVMSRDVAGM